MLSMRNMGMFLMVLILMVNGAFGQTLFTDVAPAYGVTAGNDETWSCSWADFDRDGLRLRNCLEWPNRLCRTR
jgi:hypothetical protein